MVEELAERGTTSSNDFAWMSQMRFYYDERDGGSLEMRLLEARVSYAFEYLGNATRLVITPLTERCFRSALHTTHANCHASSLFCLLLFLYSYCTSDCTDHFLEYFSRYSRTVRVNYNCECVFRTGR